MSQTAGARLEQLKQQLNLSSSAMSREAPKDMAEERAAARFDIDALAHFWAGGKASYNLRQQAYRDIQYDPQLVIQPPRNVLEFSRSELREFTMGQIYRLAQIAQQSDDASYVHELQQAVHVYSESLSMRIGVSDSLFRNVVMMLGTKEQQAKWIDAVDNYRILGCFAMTELGHSSALRDIETVATYDQSSDEFIIQSPSITSTKWWIGMAGQTATHAVVICQTVIRGQSMGHNWFVVQLRDKINGQLLPKVKAGDIGEKVGHNGVDNGWIQFDHVRVPRSHMLSKWVNLDRDGNFEQAPNPAVMYATLIPERLALVRLTVQLVTQALVIACRYGVVRRQGPKNQQIMDYQSHYVKLIPAIAFMYMARFSADTLHRQFEVLTASGNMDRTTYLNHMGDMHAISACFKGLSGYYSTDILETVRRSCGGHAYSAYNAIGSIVADHAVMTTGGGDNVVLLQQTTRFLLYRLSQKTHPQLDFKSSTHYLLQPKRYLALSTWPVTDMDTCLENLHVIEEALYAILVKRLDSIQKAQKEGQSENDLLLESVRVAELHCAAFLFSDNAARFSTDRHPDEDTNGVKTILRQLTAVWGLHVMHTYSDQGFKEGFFSPHQIKAIEAAYIKLCKSLRKQVIGLTDAWGYPDFILKAPIGKYDGNIYQAYFETVLQAPNSTGVPSYHNKYIRPLTERTRSKI
ncbi:uncharacterized protein BYT42DRAFT_552987 [Radiomyces spectabilis]|uniref:uncharacterized protein n=1 Tax=Radiomyces spectabilis TaxID=64574 RepID=UPI00221F531C|nr:uncharacterized protein BYT42DRAFT_552987 [Radiomyces spectabilis]KAI8393994.1 hypothetical protein BYT42DRAFT_552987 [Radiomyces spectabilis]